MGLLESIFFRDWPRPLEMKGPPDLTLDLKGAALGAFRIDAPVDRIKERFGPPASWKRLRHGEWVYPRLGVCFDVEKDRIATFYVVARGPELTALRPWQKEWKAWTGTILFPDGFRAPGLEVKVEDFLQHAGQPSDRDDDSEGPVLTYAEHPNFPDLFIEVDFTPAGELASLELTG
jgi:hypothetical protein